MSTAFVLTLLLSGHSHATLTDHSPKNSCKGLVFQEQTLHQLVHDALHLNSRTRQRENRRLREFLLTIVKKFDKESSVTICREVARLSEALNMKNRGLLQTQFLKEVLKAHSHRLTPKQISILKALEVEAFLRLNIPERAFPLILEVMSDNPPPAAVFHTIRDLNFWLLDHPPVQPGELLEKIVASYVAFATTNRFDGLTADLSHVYDFALTLRKNSFDSLAHEFNTFVHQVAPTSTPHRFQALIRFLVTSADFPPAQAELELELGRMEPLEAKLEAYKILATQLIRIHRPQDALCYLGIVEKVAPQTWYLQGLQSLARSQINPRRDKRFR